MRTRVQKWGNSLAVRIPKAFALEAGLDDRAEIELTMSAGKVVIEPVTPREFTLDDLLAGVHGDNIHGEVDTGASLGLEEW